MELRQIRQFVVLSELLNFHRAAEALNMSQPPLSISIRKLEQELGVQLFERQARGVTLTEAGMVALPHARGILKGLDAMTDAIDATVDGTGGRLNVGFVGSAVYMLLPRAVPIFRAERPAVDLRLREMTTLEIVRGLETGDLDIGVLRTPVLDTGEVALEPLLKEEIILLMPLNHRMAGQAVVRLEDLRDEPFIGHDRVRTSNYWNLFMGACEAAGFQPKIVEEAAQLHTLIALTESGIGLTFAPAVSRIPAGDRVATARLTVKGEPIMIGLALATSPSNSRPTRNAFLTALRQAADQLMQAGAVPPGITGAGLRGA